VDTVSTSARWWTDNTEGYVEWLRQGRELSEGYLKRNRRYLLAFRRDCQRAGTATPMGPTDVSREHIQAVKGCGIWGPRTLKAKFSVLCGFLIWANNPPSNGKNPVWRLPAGFVDHRNWIDPNEMVALNQRAEGRTRVRVVLP